MGCFIFIQKLCEHRIAFFACHQSSWNRMLSFKTRNCMVLQQTVQRSNHFNICIHVDTAFMNHSIQSCNITDKCPFLCLVCLPDIIATIQIKVTLVPLFDLVVRAIFFPRGDTFLRQLRQRISTEPAVMDDFRNHFVFLSILFIAIFYTERRQLNLASDTV